MKESFSSLYARLYNENKTELEELRLKSKAETKKLLFGAFGTFAAIFVLILTGVGIVVVPFVMIGMITVIIISSLKSAKKDSPTRRYREIFKEKIIGPIITNVFEGAEYIPEAGWNIAQYREGNYEEWIDRYHSEDYIKAPMKLKDGVDTCIEFCEVHTERESRDKDGHTSYHTIFHGIASKMKIDKSLGTDVYIKRNWAGSGKNKVKLDSPEFEKKFDVVCENQILAVRLMTSDVMAEMVDIREKYGYAFEMHILRDKIYMRVFTGGIFEPNIFKESLEYQTVEKYYKMLQAMMNLSKHIYKVIEEIEL